MGLIHPDRHDIFVSYAHDDDTRYDGYVSRFRDELQRRLTPAVRVECDPEPGRTADVFIDQRGLPKSGELNSSLKESAGRAEILFVFVGSVYLKSDHCGKELYWFRDRFNGVLKTALDRTYIIVLEKEVLDEARRIFSSDGAEPIVEPFYDRQSRKPLGLSQPDENKEFERRFQSLLDDLAKRVAALMAATAPTVETPPLAEHDRPIMIGIVPRRLEAVRQALGERLRARSIGVDLISRDDLALNPDSLLSRAEAARFFVQPFDLGEVEVDRRDEAGGHLSRQTKLLAPTKVEQRWWWVSAAGLDEPERDPAHLAYLNGIAATAEPLDRFVARLLNDPEPPDRVCRVMIEYSLADAHNKKLLDDCESLLRERWETHNGTGCQLNIRQADWGVIHSSKTLPARYHGLVIIDRSKEYDSLEKQIDTVEDKLGQMSHGRSLFVLPPKIQPTLIPDRRLWRTVIFVHLDQDKALTLTQEGENQLQQFFEDIHQAASSNSGVGEAPGAELALRVK